MAPTFVKLIFFGYLLSLSVRAYLYPDFWSLINGVNLIFHEAGHVLMLLFGEWLHIFGGTLFEFGIPLTITLYFLIRRQVFAAAFGAWWLAYALNQISIYAGDAQARLLPLLGGDSVTHDWHYLLSSMNILKYDAQVAGLFVALSISVLGWSIWLLYKDIRVTLKPN